MNLAVMFVMAILGILLQTNVFNIFTIGGVKPDIILILAIFYSIFQGPKKGVFFGFAIGLLEDLYLGRFIGMNALAKGITSFFTGWITGGAFRENLLVPIISLVVGTLLNQFIFLSLGKLAGLQWSWSLWFWKGVPLAIYNSCLVPFIYSKFYYWAIKEKEKEAL